MRAMRVLVQVSGRGGWWWAEGEGAGGVRSVVMVVFGGERDMKVELQVVVVVVVVVDSYTRIKSFICYEREGVEKEREIEGKRRETSGRIENAKLRKETK